MIGTLRLLIPTCRLVRSGSLKVNFYKRQPAKRFCQHLYLTINAHAVRVKRPIFCRTRRPSGGAVEHQPTFFSASAEKGSAETFT